jgi:hypothetical protein
MIFKNALAFCSKLGWSLMHGITLLFSHTREIFSVEIFQLWKDLQFLKYIKRLLGKNKTLFEKWISALKTYSHKSCIY